MHIGSDYRIALASHTESRDLASALIADQLKIHHVSILLCFDVVCGDGGAVSYVVPHHRRVFCFLAPCCSLELPS